jgi:hypothetical protein
LGARLLEGEGAGEAGQWASSVRTGGGAGPRAARERPGRWRRNIENRCTRKKKEKKEMVTDRWGQTGGMTEKERITEKRTGMTEKRMGMTEKRIGMTENRRNN